MPSSTSPGTRWGEGLRTSLPSPSGFVTPQVPEAHLSGTTIMVGYVALLKPVSPDMKAQCKLGALNIFRSRAMQAF